MKPVKIDKAFFVQGKTLFPILPIAGKLPKKFTFMSRRKTVGVVKSLKKKKIKK